MNIKCFDDLINALNNGRYLEDICKERGNNVEVYMNDAYEDQDLYEFLYELNTKLIDFKNGIMTFYTGTKYYELPYTNRDNRFGDRLPKETIINFDTKNIVDVTKNFK